MVKSSTSSLASPGSTSSSSCSTASSTSTRCSTSGPTTLRLKASSSCIDRRKRLAANARERKRMNLLNNAYNQLRCRLVDAENKSKYDVLVQAKEYIQALASVLEKFDQQHPEQAAQRNNKLYLNASQIKMQTSPVDMTYNHPEARQAGTSATLMQHQQQHQQDQQNHKIKQVSFT